MPDTLRFVMPPAEDLSTRADFSFDLMSELSKEVRAIVDAIPKVQELRNKALVDTYATGTLRSINVEISVKPNPGVTLTEQEIEDAKREISETIDGRIRDRISAVLQTAIDRARERM